MPTRVVMIKPGLDSHYRGAIVVSRHLVASGMEVVYAGHQSPAAAAATVAQEDADVLGISSLSGNHLSTVPAILAELRRHDLGHVLVLVGGVIPDTDRPALRDAGVAAIFGTGSVLAEISDFIEKAMVGSATDGAPRRSA